MNTQQAEVTEANPVPAQETGEVENAQEEVSLDSLLSEYNEPIEEPKKEEPQPTASYSPDVQTFMERQIKKDNDLALHEASKAMKAVVGDVNLSNKWFEGQLHLAASKDPRLIQAFNNREASPKQWEAVVNTLGKELAQELTPTDQAATDSWNAVESAVHSASTSKVTEAAPDFGSMTDSEFMAWKVKHG